MSEEKEIWKVYKDTRGSKNGKGSLWEVSTFGHIRRNGEAYIPKDERYLAFSHTLLHRAVAELFIDNPQNLPCIDHIDRDKHNNHVSNLRWCTYKENRDNIDKEAYSKKMSESCKGERNGMFGRHFSEESRKKISESNKGKQISNETKKKLSESHKGEKNAMYGKPSHFKGHYHTTEVKQRISESLTGKPFSEEHKRHLREAWARRKMSDSHKKKMDDLSKSAI